MCFFEEWGHSSLERLRSEERSGQERSQTILRTMSSWVVSKRASSSRAGPTRERKKNAFRLFLFFQERETERAKVGKSRSEMCHGVHLGNPHGLLVGVFGRSREMNDARAFRAKKNPRARLFTGKVLNVRRGRETRRRAHHATRASHARETRALDARSSRGFLSLADFTRISRQTALGGGTAEDHATHFSRDRLSPEASRAFFERAFDSQTARTPRCAGGDPEPKHRTRESGRGGASRCFSARCFSAAARPSRR